MNKSISIFLLVILVLLYTKCFKIFEGFTYLDHNIIYPDFHYTLQKWQEANPNINKGLKNDYDYRPPHSDNRNDENGENEFPWMEDTPGWKGDELDEDKDYKGVPNVYRNFPNNGKKLRTFYDKCMTCAKDKMAFIWSPSAENIPNCRDFDKDDCDDNPYCEFKDDSCQNRNLTPARRVELTKIHYDNVDLEKIGCSDITDSRKKEFYNLCKSSADNCNTLSKDECRVDYDLKRFCNFENNKCRKYSDSECESDILLQSYISNTCLNNRSSYSYSDITGRYGCPGDIAPNLERQSLVCPDPRKDKYPG